MVGHDILNLFTLYLQLYLAVHILGKQSVQRFLVTKLNLVLQISVSDLMIGRDQDQSVMRFILQVGDRG